MANWKATGKIAAPPKALHFYVAHPPCGNCRALRWESLFEGQERLLQHIPTEQRRRRHRGCGHNVEYHLLHDVVGEYRADPAGVKQRVSNHRANRQMKQIDRVGVLAEETQE